MTYNDLTTSAPVVLVEFFATWCPHCAAMEPVMEQVKEIISTRAKIYQLDIDKNREAADNEGVTATPTFFLYRNGSQVWTHAGEIEGNALLQKIEQAL